MLRQAQQLLKETLGQSVGRRRVRKLYERFGYLDAYSRHTDLRVEQDPHEAVGGLWEEMGRLQFDFLKRNGLEPGHSLLDIGCGTLRGGRHFIRYLQPGRYTGIDISEGALAYGRKLLIEEDLADRDARLVLNAGKRLDFAEFQDQSFDYLLAQSVFTHLPRDLIEECFLHVRQVMHERSLFFFTYFSAADHLQSSKKNFRHPWAFFEGLAARHGYAIDDVADSYDHPSKQRMVKMQLA
jgi:SAM-dependent methyltransferase